MDDAAIMRWRGQVDLAIKRFARGLTREDKEDLRQDCYLDLVLAEDRINQLLSTSEQEAQRYVYTSAKNRIIKQISTDAHHRKQQSLSEFEVLMQAERTQPQESEVLSEDVLALERAIAKLPQIEQYVLKSVYYGEVPQETLAVELGKSRSWVRKTLELAIQKLKVIMESE